jgi:hypothetical protein
MAPNTWEAVKQLLLGSRTWDPIRGGEVTPVFFKLFHNPISCPSK